MPRIAEASFAPGLPAGFFFRPVLFGLVLSAGPSTWVERAGFIKSSRWKK
jgi:hypothetical protein